MSIDIQEYRRNKLIKLLKEFKIQGKSVAQLAKDYPIDPSYISQLKTKHRGFGEDAARNLEAALELSAFYFEPHYEQLAKSMKDNNHLQHLDAIVKMSTPEMMELTNQGLNIEELQQEFPMSFIADITYFSDSDFGKWKKSSDITESHKKDLIIIGSNISTAAYAILFETNDFFPAIRMGWGGLFDPACGVNNGDLTHVILENGTHFVKEYLYSKDDIAFFVSLNSNLRDSFPYKEIKSFVALRGLVPPECITMKIV